VFDVTVRMRNDPGILLRSRVLAVLLCVLMLPSVGEILEIAAHAVDHGDLAHVVDREEHEHPEGDEHGWTELFHICGCHSGCSLPAPTATRASSMPRPSQDVAFADVLCLVGQFDPSPALRPPIA
jgi:hypothetical protein